MEKAVRGRAAFCVYGWWNAVWSAVKGLFFVRVRVHAGTEHGVCLEDLTRSVWRGAYFRGIDYLWINKFLRICLKPE